MAIVKRGYRVSGVSSQSQCQAPCNSSIYDDGFSGKHCRPYQDDDDGDDDADSSSASESSESSDGCDVGERGTELCRVGEQNCNIPYELFDLPDLRPVLSLDTWNHFLTDEERFRLSAYLPDADQQTFMHTLKELLAGENIHFGSPLVELFDMLKGGLCQPQVARYREGLKYLERKEHYHFLRTYQDNMVSNLLEMRETWERCSHLSIDDRLSIWNLRKCRKAFRAEPQALPPRLSEQKQKFKHLLNEKIGPLTRSIKMPKLTRDENLLEVVEPPPKQKASTNKLDGKYSLAGKMHAKTSLEVHSSRTLQSKETEKFGKRFPEEMPKLGKRNVLMKHGWTGLRPEIGQHAQFSELQDLGIKSEPLSLLPSVNKWEADDFVGETSFTMRKTRSRTKINSSETSFSHAKGNQSWNYSNSNAGQETSSSPHGRKLGRIKEPEMYNRIGVQAPSQFSENIGRFKQESNLARGRTIFADSEKRGERTKVLEEGTRKHPQELSKEKVNIISSKNSRKYPQERVMFDLYSDAEEKGQNSEKMKRNIFEHQKSPTKQYRLPVDHDFACIKQQSLPFLLKQNSHKEDMKQPEPCKEKKGKTDYFKNSKKLKRKNGAINQSSKELLRISAKKKKSIEQSLGEHQVECLEVQSALAQNRRYALGVSLSLDNPRSDEGKKKKRNQRPIDNEPEELVCSENPKEHTEIPKWFQRKFKDSDKSDTDEILLSQTEEYEDVDDIGDTKLVSSIHNDAQMSLYLQSGEDKFLHKRAKTNLEEDAEIVVGVVSNRSVGNSQYGLHEQTDKAKPLKKMGKKMSKADAVVLTGGKELNGLHVNPRFGSCQELVGAKPLKRGAKKAEDAKILDRMAESNGIKGSAQPLICLDGDECKPGNRKSRKVKADAEILGRVSELNALHNSDQPNCQQIDESKHGKKRVKEDNTVSLATLSSKQAIIADKVTTDTKPSKKLPPMAIPSVASSFSFSVIHFLSAVRTAMLFPSAEDISEVVNHSEKSDGERESSNQEGQFTFSSDGKAEDQNCVFLNCRLDGHPDMCKTGIDPSYPERERQASPSSIPFQEIVKRVQMNPGDPCVLETQEPLQDLVRGALKIFASKTAPPGVKGWKPLAVYDKSTRSWSWIGPVVSSSPRHESMEVQSPSEAWGISQKMLLKLVEAFANWLKNGQETLQQIVLLPTPPPPSMPTCIDEKERFRDLRAQKSSITITPSSADMRAYFRREEVLRYSVPDRAFSYTAVDGRKAVVAPLRRCGGKPTSKARDHFMLKPDRPPHVTILCLVRDAAARLPGSIGTRADVCTLIRDSQYIVEDVSDAQVNQVVSGALDRLHYERDPCVQFDGDRKLWVYLHSERAEEDFEDDGTSSTKRWKRQKKDNVENLDPAPCNDGTYHGMDDQDGCGSGLGFDFCSPDYNGDSSSIYSGGKAELVYNKNGSLTSPRVLRSGFNGSNMDDGMVPFIDLPPSIHSVPGSMHESHPMGWEVLGLNPLGHGSNLKSQEHISNKDFDNDTFSRERPIELLRAGLL